ncbi:hypothetical protein BCR39DRAFT_539098 [Naematelia encephala]|uniref:Uncharacterized protein n=1 Tax=Naematelia encephala TaxID=71784 RepID=A0A1Y2AXQ2_9TREE|nr:hypothetical protein BCR39DRAFT_539098 [Naematelia encephala]
MDDLNSLSILSRLQMLRTLGDQVYAATGLADSYIEMSVDPWLSEANQTINFLNRANSQLVGFAESHGVSPTRPYFDCWGRKLLPPFYSALRKSCCHGFGQTEKCDACSEAGRGCGLCTNLEDRKFTLKFTVVRPSTGTGNDSGNDRRQIHVECDNWSQLSEALSSSQASNLGDVPEGWSDTIVDASHSNDSQLSVDDPRPDSSHDSVEGSDRWFASEASQ